MSPTPPIEGTQIGPDGKRVPIPELPPLDPKARVNPAEDVGRPPLPGEGFNVPPLPAAAAPGGTADQVAHDHGTEAPVDLESLSGPELLELADLHGFPVKRSARVGDLRDQVALFITPLDELTGPKLHALAEAYGFEDVPRKGKVSDLRAFVAEQIAARS